MTTDHITVEQALEVLERELKDCGHGREYPHICPYRSEINNDDSVCCTCCSGCEHECAMDV